MSSSLFLRLSDFNGKSLNRSGQYEGTGTIDTTLAADNRQFLEIMAFSCDVLQTLNMGSQSTGAGAGKVVFNPLNISRRMDAVSPLLFQAAATGAPFKTAELLVVLSPSNTIVAKYLLKLVAVKSVAWTNSDEGVIENVSFEYGGLLMSITQQQPNGQMSPGQVVGWNRVKNISDNDPAKLIS